MPFTVFWYSFLTTLTRFLFSSSSIKGNIHPPNWILLNMTWLCESYVSS
jgi:hypothetical protein